MTATTAAWRGDCCSAWRAASQDRGRSSATRSAGQSAAILSTNLRQSFEGLTHEIRHALGYEPLNGHVFVFLNRRRNQVQLILWTRGGFTIVHKRLERGTFTFPAHVVEGMTSVAIDVHELAVLLEGIEVDERKTKPRWEPTEHARSPAL
ncbi:MAG TPA: IS66 family insertion sequence element accessory protein TnpB [Kofleriaceae bacterium]|nr:IS66 family insertion sequence element accessory protein TnpB [Kofleriaceae bacterium]